MRNVSRRDLISLGGPRNASDGDPLVHIASLLVQTSGTADQAVRNCVSRMPAAEIHETERAGKLVVVLESADSRAIADAASELQQLAGVLTVSIVAHLTERASLLDESNESTTVSAQ
jgi:nitrate reductase NapAB chaperone NapD